MKAPDTYPKKADLKKFARVKSEQLPEYKSMQQISHLDFDSDGERLLVVGHVTERKQLVAAYDKDF